MNFENYKSVKNLKKLSQRPIDLTKDGVISKERIEQFKKEALEYKLLYACERVDEEVLEELNNLALESKCVEKMQSMQKGEIVNYSENRKVLHTALRDFSKNPQEKEARDLAFLEIKKLEKFTEKKKYSHIVQIGIGGSILAVETIAKALFPFRNKNVNVHFVSNIDPNEVCMLLEKIDFANTLFISVSKSGTTLETRVNEKFIRQELKKRKLDPKTKIVAITGKNSPMDNKDEYLEVFYIWDYIGGRFSVTSMVGGVLMSLFLGFENYMQFLKGAYAMDNLSRSKNLDENIALFSALLSIWNRNFLNYQTLCEVCYSSLLLDLCCHLQQCYMESNGKSIDKDGNSINFKTSPIVWGGVGTDCQHSFFQFLHQGKDIACVEFIGFCDPSYKKDILINKTYSQEKLLANMFAQALSLAIGKKDDNPNKNFEGNRPSSILLGKQLNPFSLGSLIAFFEHKVAFQGFLWNINSFDQEGVQLGKKIANDIINIFAKEDKKNYELGRAFINQLF